MAKRKQGRPRITWTRTFKYDSDWAGTIWEEATILAKPKVETNGNCLLPNVQ